MEDLDDLFGDHLEEHLDGQLGGQLGDQLHGQLNIPEVTPPPPPSGLRERVNELRLSGCTDKIAWSKTGSIAYITKDRREVHIANLRFRGSDGKWTQNHYTDPLLAHSVTNIYKGRQLVHVAWNPTQTHELLVSDAHGRIGIFHNVLTINRLQGLAVLNIDPEDSLNALVGLTWLNTKRVVPLSKAALKVNGQWKYSMANHETRGPYTHPSRSIFVAITSGGRVRLGYQGPTQLFNEARHDLDGFSTSGDLITHATICADKDEKLLLAVHTYSKQIRLYTIKIDGYILKPGEQSQNSPTIECQHVGIIDACCPLGASLLSPGEPAPELSHLHILSRSTDSGGDHLLPCVLAVFTGLSDQSMGTDAAGSSYSIFARWELKEETPILDSSFAQLGSKKSSENELKTEQILKRLEDVRVNRLALSLHLLHNCTVLAFASYDGNIEFRSRNLDIFPIDENPDRVTSLTQLGFDFHRNQPCLHVALSPNYTVKAYFGNDHIVKTSSMQLAAELVDFNGIGKRTFYNAEMSSDNIATSDKIAGAFVMANAVAEANSHGSNTNDDLLMTMQKLSQHLTDEQSQILQSVFLKDLYTLFGLHEKLLDSNSSIDKIIRPSPATRCLSVQAALGDRGEKQSRTLPSKMAYTTLNLRNFCLSLAAAFSKGQNVSEPEINRPDVLQYLINLTSWFGTLVDYICDQLLDLNRTLDLETTFDLNMVKDRIAYLNSPVLHLLLSSFTRSLLRQSGRAMRTLAPMTQTPAAQFGAPLHSLYASLLMALKSNLATPPVFESLLTEIENSVQKAYSGFSENKKQETELNLLLLGEIPDALEGAVCNILTTSVDKIRSSAPSIEANLAFKDWKILGLQNDGRSKLWRKETIFDTMRKTELPRSTRIRRCTRCDGAMEDLVGPKMSKGGMVFRQMFSSCLCGGSFLVDPSP